MTYITSIFKIILLCCSATSPQICYKSIRWSDEAAKSDKKPSNFTFASGNKETHNVIQFENGKKLQGTCSKRRTNSFNNWGNGPWESGGGLFRRCDIN